MIYITKVQPQVHHSIIQWCFCFQSVPLCQTSALFLSKIVYFFVDSCVWLFLAITVCSYYRLLIPLQPQHGSKQAIVLDVQKRTLLSVTCLMAPTPSGVSRPRIRQSSASFLFPQSGFDPKPAKLYSLIIDLSRRPFIHIVWILFVTVIKKKREKNDLVWIVPQFWNFSFSSLHVNRCEGAIKGTNCSLSPDRRSWLLREAGIKLSEPSSCFFLPARSFFCRYYCSRQPGWLTPQTSLFWRIDSL